MFENNCKFRASKRHRFDDTMNEVTWNAPEKFRDFRETGPRLGLGFMSYWVESLLSFFLVMRDSEVNRKSERTLLLKSLIIHEEKTKEIITWGRFGYVILVIIKFCELFLWIINALRSHIKHSKKCFIRYPNTSQFVKRKNRLRLFFFNHLVFGYLMKRFSS